MCGNNSQVRFTTIQRDADKMIASYKKVNSRYSDTQLWDIPFQKGANKIVAPEQTGSITELRIIVIFSYLFRSPEHHSTVESATAVVVRNSESNSTYSSKL